MLAVDLAGFVRAMIPVDPMDGPDKEGFSAACLWCSATSRSAPTSTVRA